MLRFALLYFCSTPKNYTSTFKVRARLSEFFKHVHPDQLTQAPTKVKQQNLRSLTNFNAYIDSISQAKTVEAKLLKFYIAEKSNSKSKKYFSFTVELPELGPKDAGMDEAKAKQLIDNIVEVLNRKFIQSKTIKGKGKNKQDEIAKVEALQAEKQQQTERFSRMAQTIKPFERKSNKTQLQAQLLKNTLNSKYMQVQKQNLSTKLRKTISFADTSRNKPMMWAKIASEELGFYKDYQTIMDQLIDPRLIYFDQSITMAQTEQCNFSNNLVKKRLLPGSSDKESYRNSKIILQVCSKMESFDPPLCFYISNKYSSTDIPGFLTIPYNFKAEELAKYYEKQVNNVLQEQQKFQNYLDYETDLRKQLKIENNFQIAQKQFKNNEDIRSWILMLKRLQKYKSNLKISVNAFDRETYEVYEHKYKQNINGSVSLYNGKIVMAIDFQDLDMQNVIDTINNQKESAQQ